MAVVVYKNFAEMYAHLTGKAKTVEPKEYVEPVKKEDIKPLGEVLEKAEEAKEEAPKKRTRKKKTEE